MAVVLAVGIWVILYAIADNTTTLTATLLYLVAAPVVVLGFLLYEVSGRWRRHAHEGRDPEQMPRKIARAVVAVLVAAGIAPSRTASTSPTTPGLALPSCSWARRW